MGSSVPLWPTRGSDSAFADPFDDVVGSEAGGLVEQKEEAAAERVGRSHGSSLSGPGRTSESSSSIRAPRSYERSGWKKSSGA